MVHVPVDDAGELHIVFQGIQFTAVTIRFKAVVAGSRQNIDGLGSVTGNPAVFSNLLERYPFPIVRHNHGKGSRTALERFHLHDYGHFYPALFDRLFDFILTHAADPQRNSSLMT